jgi:hypothetical protein
MYPGNTKESQCAIIMDIGGGSVSEDAKLQRKEFARRVQGWMTCWLLPTGTMHSVSIKQTIRNVVTRCSKWERSIVMLSEFAFG